MATERILIPPWRAENATTFYPFADGATLTNGTAVLPPELFVDASLYPIGAGPNMRLAQVVVTNQAVTLVIGDDDSAETATVTFPLLDPPAELRLLDKYGRPAGLLLADVAQLSIFQSWSPGTYAFSTAESAFAASCCAPTPEICARGFLLAAGTVLTGDVWLVGDNGVVLSSHTVVDNTPGMLGGPQTYTVIRVDIVGDPLFKRAETGDTFVTMPFLQTLTIQDHVHSFVCTPDALGACQITAGHGRAEDSVLRIRATADGLMIETVGESSAN